MFSSVGEQVRDSQFYWSRFEGQLISHLGRRRKMALGNTEKGEEKNCG